VADTIRALSRGLSVLEYLSEVGGATSQATATHFGLSRPTIYRILGTLVEGGLISLDEDEVYRPTLAARALGEGLTDEAWALWAASPVLLDLQKEVVWTCEIATFENYAMVKRETTHALNPFRIDVKNFDDSRHSMLTSACGRAYLAFCPTQEATQILEHIARFGDPVDSKARSGAHVTDILAKVRSDGYATEQRSAYPRVTSIAAPIGYQGRVLACISINWIARAVKLQEGINQFLPALKRTQAAIEERLALDAGDLPSAERSN